MRFQLDLEERHADRVFITVRLDPQASGVHVEGVAIELQARSGEALSARLMLPISGPLPATLTLRTEIRAWADLPRGGRVHGVVWWNGGQLETTCPTDPGTCLESFVRGGGVPLDALDLDDLPRPLTRGEHRALVHTFPWLDGFRLAEGPEAHILEEADADPAADVADRYDLSEEDRELLRELLAEDDDLDDDVDHDLDDPHDGPPPWDRVDGAGPEPTQGASVNGRMDPGRVSRAG
jgi:hypothetical protein